MKLDGKKLTEARGLDGWVIESRASKRGNFYMLPNQFPCVFHDIDGYLIVQDGKKFQELKDGRWIYVGVRLNVPNGGIKSIPGYVRDDRGC